MSKRSNPALIGGFVLGAIVLIVVGVLLFGGGRFFTNRDTLILYFQGSVSGLVVGAPVRLKGVRLGSVTDLWIEFEYQALEFRTAVLVQVETDRIREVGAPRISDDDIIDELIKNGLRARLTLESFVTGLLFIELDFYRNTPIRLVGNGRYDELPTIPSALDELTQRIENIPIDKIAAEANITLRKLNEILSAPEIMDIVRNFNQTVIAVEKLVHDTDTNAVQLSAQVERILESARATLETVQQRLALQPGETLYTLNETLTEFRQLARNMDTKITPLATEFQQSAEQANAALEQAQTTLASVQTLFSERSPLRHDLSRTLSELATAASSIRALADFIERHPEALLRGKSGRR